MFNNNIKLKVIRIYPFCIHFYPLIAIIHFLFCLSGVFNVSIDYLEIGNKSDKLEQTLKDAELIKQFQQPDKLPDEKTKSILKVISALIRDFNARQAYAM